MNTLVFPVVIVAKIGLLEPEASYIKVNFPVSQIWTIKI